MKNLFKDALILFIITLVAGTVLGFVYELTKDAREEQAVIKQNNAYKAVFEDYDGFEGADMSAATFEEIDIEAIAGLTEALEQAGYTSSVVTIDGVVQYISGANTYGYVVTVTAKEGYGGDIQFTVGFDMNGTVTGVSMLSISETAGLGMKAKEAEFLNQYVGKSGGSFVVNKDNSAGAANEIDAISGATVTTRAVTKGVNAAYITVNEILNGGDINE